MNTTPEHDSKMANMTFATVYPLYKSKVERKGRTVSELNKVIGWLTGFSTVRIMQLIEEKVTFRQFFEQANLNPNAHKITGSICGYKIQEIQNPITRQVRYLDKLVDELAKGKNMTSILRE